MTTAVEWEISLSEKIAYVELLGELNLSSDEVLDLGQAIKQMVVRNGQISAASILRNTYPSCLAVYMVFKGISGYDSGDYWSAVGEETGLTSASAHQEMRKAFEKFLRENGLPLFGDLGGLRYVTPILLHGGVPDTSLHDYFTYFLLRMQDHSVSCRAEARDLINEWLYKHAHSVPVDKAVSRFLEHGGNFALDFVTRCLELSEYYEQHHRLPASETIGLPPRVLHIYKSWNDERLQGANRRQPLQRLVRPTLVLDPWGGELVIELPAQTLSSNLNIESACWSIEHTQSGRERKLAETSFAPTWSEVGWETAAYHFELPRPGNYSITLEVNEGQENRPLRTWYFHCLSSEQQPALLAFDGESGEFLAARDTLPARLLWLLIPRMQTFQAVGGVKREEVARFTGSWAPFKAEAWDLTSATSVTLDKRSFAVEPDMLRFQPYLLGEEVTEVEQQPGQPRLFTRQLPDLYIPLPAQRDPEIEAQRWHITVVALYARARRSLLVSSLATTQYHRTTKDDGTHIHLALYEQPAFKDVHMGMFEIALRGPLGRDITFHIALVPALQIQVREQDRVRMPAQGKVPDLTFTLTTGVPSQLESAVSGIRIQSEEKRRYHVRVSGTCSRADLRLKLGDEDTGSTIPLTLPLPILSWALVEGQSTTLRDIPWQTSIIDRPQAWLEQAEAPRLLVGLTVGHQHLAPGPASLRVTYSRRAEPHMLAARGQGKTWLTFNLEEAEDSVHAGREGSILFELEPTPFPRLTQQTRFLPVLRLEQTLGLTSLALEGVLVDQTWLLELRWQEQISFSNRHLLLWPLCRPWEQALDIPVPDNVQLIYEFLVPLATLAPGTYRVEMTLIDPWSGNDPARPFTSAAHSIDLMLGDVEQHATYMREGAQDLPGLLEQLLASESEQHRQHCALELSRQMAPRFIQHILTTLLTLQENPTATASFDLLGSLLVREPLELLAAIARLSLPLTDQARRPFEELLWRIAPNCEPLLRQIYQNASLDLDELRPFLPMDQSRSVQREALASLRDASIQIREQFDAEQRQAPDEPDLDNIPPWLCTENQLDSIRLYLKEIRQYPLLHALQEQKLAAHITDGREAERELQHMEQVDALSIIRTRLLEQRARVGQQARKQLAHANLRLVVSIARRYIGRSMDFLDIIQNGNLGLLKAIDKFDGTRGYKFSTYATWWIRQHILRKLLDDTSLIRLPVYVAEERFRLQRAIQKLRLLHDREPTTAELVAESGHTPEKIRLLLALEQPRSLNQSLGDDDGSTLADILEQEDSNPEEVVIAANLRDQIGEALSSITLRERAVIEMRFGLLDGDHKTLEEIGKMMHVTRERVRQIEDRALKKLRYPKILMSLREYAETSPASKKSDPDASENKPSHPHKKAKRKEA